MFAQLSKIGRVLIILTLPLMTTHVNAADEEEVIFTSQFGSSSENLAIGKEIWDEQCSACHGMRAYPGKAPKLKPSKYKIDFVYKRVTQGFRGMPSWQSVYNQHERMSVAAYVMSPTFNN